MCMRSTRGSCAGPRRRGATLIAEAEVTACEQVPRGGWRVITSAGAFEADVLVNAAGAWAEPVGALAGAMPIAVQPCAGRPW